MDALAPREIPARMVCVWFPHLPIERMRRERLRAGRTPPPDKKPFALVLSGAHGLRLTALNAPSLREGLKQGMRLADARAICPALLTEPAAPRDDAAFLTALARWSVRYSPCLNVDGSEGLWLDITGIAHLFGGEAALLADFKDRLGKAGLSARLGAAETLGAAHALSRYGRRTPYIALAGTLRKTLAPLPIEGLRLEPAAASLLRRLGLKRIGQLYGLPRASLERRFHSKEAVESVLRRLDEALGVRKEARIPLLPAPDFVARLSFAEPLITHDGVLASLDRLAGALCQRLSGANRGARRIALWAARTDGSCAVIKAGLSAPSATPAHLASLLKERIETIDMGFGVDLMALAALSTEALYPVQTGLVQKGFAERSHNLHPEKLIDALASRLGEHTPRRLFPHESHIPELAQIPRSAFAGLPLWAESWTLELAERPPRPPFLLARPEPIAVMAEIPEGPPARFTWRRVGHSIVKAEGPERIAPEWWRRLDQGAPLEPRTMEPPGAQERPRDYYRIEDEDGCRYWVFREGLYQEEDTDPPRWFLHGVFP